MKRHEIQADLERSASHTASGIKVEQTEQTSQEFV